MRFDGLLSRFRLFLRLYRLYILGQKRFLVHDLRWIRFCLKDERGVDPLG